MAVIGRIRKYSGLLVVIVGVALAGFVLQDFFRKTGAGKGPKTFGEVHGEKIAYRDYDTKVEEQIEQAKKQDESKPVGYDKINQIRQQVWNTMVRDIIMTRQYEELGVSVSTDELYDLVQGREPHQYILQSFSNPKTKQLDRERLNQFLHNFDQLTPEVKGQWNQLEKAIKEDRINKKFNALIEGAFYIPKVFLQRSFTDKNRKAQLRFFFLPYTDIKDTTVPVTETDISNYYDEHKGEFEQNEPIRKLDYVVFEVLPSKDDYDKAAEDINKIKTEFVKLDLKDVPSYVNSNSDAKYDSTFFVKGKLPVRIDSAVFKGDEPKKDAKIKTKKPKKQKEAAPAKAEVPNIIVGPYIDNNTYYLARLIDIQERPDSMRAKHILIAYQGADKAEESIKRTKKDAKRIADSLLVVLNLHPDQFEAIARKMSNDPTAKEKGGDLGWFADGAMVYAFNKACLDHNVGERTVIESNYGYHVVEVTGKKELVKKARVAIIKRAIEASSKTQQDVYAKESRFAAENQNIAAFEKSVAKQGLNKRVADYLREMDMGLPGIEQAREVVRWAFEEKTKKGDVKDFELENKYVVATLKEVKNKGIPKLDEIRSQLIPLVKNEKKVAILTKKIDDAKAGAPLFEQLAAKLSCKIDSAKDITFSSYSLPGTGPEPAVLGRVFTMKKGDTSNPLKGTKGVFVVRIDNFIEPAPKADYRNEYYQQASYFKQRANYEVYNALQKKADVVDNRREYF